MDDIVKSKNKEPLEQGGYLYGDNFLSSITMHMDCPSVFIVTALNQHK